MNNAARKMITSVGFIVAMLFLAALMARQADGSSSSYGIKLVINPSGSPTVLGLPIPAGPLRSWFFSCIRSTKVPVVIEAPGRLFMGGPLSANLLRTMNDLSGTHLTDPPKESSASPYE